MADPNAPVDIQAVLQQQQAAFLQHQQALIASFEQSQQHTAQQFQQVTAGLTALTTSLGQQGQHLQGLTDQLSARSTGSTTNYAESLAGSITGLIDYNSKAGIHLLETSQKGTAVDFDGSPEKYEGWMTSVSAIAKNIALDNISKITDSNGNKVDLFKQGAATNIEDIRAHALPYINGNDLRSRRSQNNGLGVALLFNSMTESFRSQVRTEKEKYTIHEVVKNPSDPDDKSDVISFTLLLKVVIDRVTRNCSSKKNEIIESLRRSDEKMVKLGRDAEKYFSWFQSTSETYVNLGGSTEDFIKYFNKGLQQASCKNIREWARTTHTTLENSGGYMPWGDKGAMVEVTYPIYQAKAIDQVRTLESTGSYGVEDEQIIALKAEINTLNNALRGGLRTSTPVAQSSKQKSNSSRKKPANSKKGKNKKNRSDRQRQRFHEEWRKKEPAPGEPHTKIVDGKKEIWCIHHNLWQRHTSEDCELGKQQREAAAQAHKVGHVSNSTYAQATKATSSMQALADLSRSD